MSILYIVFAVAGGLLPLLFLQPALRNRDKPGSTGMIVCTFAAMIYALAIAVRSVGLTGVALFAVENIVLLGASLGGIGWYLMFAEYTGLISSTRRALIVLGAFVLVYQLGLWTNPLHHLFFDPIPALASDTRSNRRVLYWVFSGILYMLVLVGTIALAADVVRSQGIRQRQGLYMLCGAVAPVVTIAISATAELIPVNITPLGFVIATGILTWAMFRANFLEIVSVGRSRAIEGIKDPVVTIDNDDHVVDSNPAARAVFDAGENWDGASASEFFAPFADRIREIRRADTDATKLSLTRIESQYHFDVETTPIYGPQDRKQAQLVVFRDVTELKSREQQLREVTNRYDIALEGTDTGVWEWNLQTDAIDYDEQMQQLFGLSDGETIETYTQASERIHPADRDDLEAAYERGIERGAYETEFRIRNDDGDRWLWVRGEFQYADGEPTRVVGIGQDITDRKQRERELQRSNELLDEFASVVAHDVATPLGVIENKARLIEITGETEHAEDIYHASERVQRLVDELRDLAKEGNDIGDTAPVDLQMVTQEAWDSVEASDATLTVVSSGTVEADRLRLRQLLEKLFENAVEHGSTNSRSTGDDAVDHDGATVEQASAGETADGNEPLSISVGTFEDGFYVKDNGSGIPSSARSSIFDHGYTTGADNTGLGLAIVRRIVEGHDWSVAASDSDSGGARFEVRTDR